MNRGNITRGGPAETDQAPTSNSYPPLASQEDEIMNQPSRQSVSPSQTQDDVLALPKGEALAASADRAHEDFVVPLSPTSQETSLKKNKLLRRPDLLRHLSEELLVPFPDSSDHKRPMQRRHSHSEALQGSGHLRHLQESVDTLDADDDNTTQSSNYNSFATDGTQSGEDGNSASRSDESSQEQGALASLPESVQKGSSHDGTHNSPEPVTTLQQSSDTRLSSTVIEELNVEMSSSTINVARQSVRSYPKAPTHPLSMIPQDSALEDDQNDEHQRFLGQLDDAGSITSIPSLSSINLNEASYIQNRSMQSIASMSSSSSEMKHSLDSLLEEHGSESSSSSEPRGNTSDQVNAKEGKAETKLDTLNPVIPQKCLRKPTSDSVRRSREKDVIPSFLTRSIDGSFRGGIPLEVPRRFSPMTEDTSVPFLGRSERPAMSEHSSPATPRTRNPKISSRQISSAVQGIVGPCNDMSTGVSYNSIDTIPRAARRRSSSSGSSFSAGS